MKLQAREKCAVCASRQLKPLKKIEAFPVLPICTDSDFETDHFAPLDVGICNDCGCLQLLTLAPREIIYSVAHSEGIGATWANHYEEFGRYVAHRLTPKMKVLEVGAGLGQIADAVKTKCALTVMEPNYGGSRDGIELLEQFFTPEELGDEGETYDAIYSSHTLEHFYDLRNYFEASKQVLKKQGVMLTAVPNLEAALHSGYANALQFEHSVTITLPHLIRLHTEFGFEISDVSYYRDHGIYVSSRKTASTVSVTVNTQQYMRFLFDKLLKGIDDRNRIIKSHLRPGVPHFLFGASQLSQFQFSCGLDSHLFDGLMDNAKGKHQKRLYGTRLSSQVPGEILAHLSEAQIFINGGPYTQEINAQLKSLKPKGVEIICL